MALKKLHSLTPGTYQAAVQPFIKWVIPYVQSTTIKDRTGWIQHFVAYSYSWGDGTWLSGVTARHHLRGRPRVSKDPPALLQAANEILDWGRLRPPFSQGNVHSLSRSLKELDLLDAGKANWSAIWAGRIAATSKVYAMHDFDKWTIYDSRAANGLAWLVHAYWQSVGNEHLPKLLRFPQPPGRATNRVPPRGFPNGSSENQFRLAFVYASWLLRAIADTLNTAPHVGKPPSVQVDGTVACSNSWKLYHVEMVLFMLGQ